MLEKSDNFILSFSEVIFPKYSSDPIDKSLKIYTLCKTIGQRSLLFQEPKMSGKTNFHQKIMKHVLDLLLDPLNHIAMSLCYVLF